MDIDMGPYAGPDDYPSGPSPYPRRGSYGVHYDVRKKDEMLDWLWELERKDVGCGPFLGNTNATASGLGGEGTPVGNYPTEPIPPTGQGPPLGNGMGQHGLVMLGGYDCDGWYTPSPPPNGTSGTDDPTLETLEPQLDAELKTELMDLENYPTPPPDSPRVHMPYHPLDTLTRNETGDCSGTATPVVSLLPMRNMSNWININRDTND
jgi:hypothetical protein